MLTYEQYDWLIAIQNGQCTLMHRDQHPDLFVDLINRKLIYYDGKVYQITEQGKLELQESKRSWESDKKANLALWMSGISLAVSLIATIMGFFFS